MKLILPIPKRSDGITLIALTSDVSGRLFERISPIERQQPATLNAIFFACLGVAALMPGVPLVIGAVRRTVSSILITCWKRIALYATNTQQRYRCATRLEPDVWGL